MQHRGTFQENVRSDVSQSDLTVTCSKACIFPLWKVFSGVRPFAGHDRRPIFNAIAVSPACQLAHFERHFLFHCDMTVASLEFLSLACVCSQILQHANCCVSTQSDHRCEAHHHLQSNALQRIWTRILVFQFKNKPQRLRETRPKTAVFFIPYVQLSIFNWVPSIRKAYSAKRLGARLYIKWDAQPVGS